MKKVYTIAIAEKNRSVRDFLLHELSSGGYNVTVVESGAQICAEIGGEHPPDLLIMDLEIPDADSAEIFEKTQRRTPPLPVIVHTFLTEESERDNLDKENIYLEKSRNIDYLKAAIVDMLKRFYPD
jgi:CheY-like chemotaxis protein